MDYALAERPKMQGLRMAGAFTFGIEEEYFLVEAGTKSLVRNMPQAFFEAATAAAEGRISPEFLQPQTEVISSPHDNMADARPELRELRQTVAAVAAEHGLAILAAGTHPAAVCPGDPRFELHLVGDAPIAPQPHARAACARLLHAGRGRRRHRSALSHARASPLCQPLAQCRSRRGRPCHYRREQ